MGDESAGKQGMDSPAGDARQSCSEIPEVSLCPPDNPDTGPSVIQSRTSGASSPSRQYHQHSLCPKRCHCCGQTQMADGSPCPTPLSSPNCSSSAVNMCHDSVDCHWPPGLRDMGTQQPLQRHVVTVRHEGLYRIPRSYSQLIVEFPMAVLISCTLVLLGCSLAGILVGPLPDFSDPLLGLEPRGTVIGNHLCAWTKLQENSGLGKPLSLLPQQLEDHSGKRYGHDNAEATRQGKAKPRMRPRRMLDWDSSQDSLFCDAPGERYAQLVFRSENSASLWSLKAIHSMCEMEQARIRSHSHFQDLCKQDRLTSNVPRAGQECCPSWSLGNYLAVLSNASSCLGLTTNQVSDSLTVLRQCAPYYHDGSLAPSCAKQGKLGQCATVPLQCKLSSAIYQILHYLVDKDFLAPQTIGYRLPSLKYSLLFLPVEKGDSMMKIYLDNLEGRDLTYSNTTITGMDLGIKRRLFKYYLAWDAVYPILAILILLLTTALYLRSFFLSAMSLAAILVSLFASYFFYTVVFRLTFFPFLNLIAVLVLLGSYCNQAFVFIDLWRIQLSQKPPASLEKRVHRVLQEIGYLILASGLTSSATFFSGYMSSITSVRCFAVYVGTASMISTFFTLVWLPCSLILRERYEVAAAAGNTCCSRNPGGFWDTSSRKRCMFTFVRKLRGLKRGLSDTSDLLFLKILPCGVVKFRYIWICWFTVLAAGGTYMTCVDPGMKLPTLESEAMQLFRSSHPFERYDSEYRHQFMFERLKSGEDRPMVVTLVWGVLPVDNGDHLNARSNGSMVMDKEFNMSTPEAQEWLRELCGRIQNQSFYAPLSSPEEATKGDNVCFVEHLLHWVSIRRCSENEDAFTFCCNNILFPYLPRVFEHCLGMMAAERYAESHTPSSAGPRFNSDGRVVALVIEFTTTHYYSFNFTQTSKFYKEIKTWFNAEMAGAPIGLHNGWFVSQLSLYDLQQSLSSEMLIVTNVGIALTFGLLLLTTWNIPLSIYGSLAVAGSVFVTAGLLVLLEWQLNGLEALFIAVASGLSIDFAANYCIAYSLAPHSDRLGRVAHSLKRMGCPAATGAAAYFCVGVIMLPANALLFRKLGIFLLVVKCVACGFATFFFQSLCCFFGPEKKCGQIVCPCSEARVQYIEKGAENMLSPCSVVGPGKCNSTANGAFGCSRKSRGGQRSSGKDMSEGHLCPGRYRQRKRLEAEGMVPEQYELQPLACHLSDSFDNSTCTSKLSNRPSVLSDEIQFRSISPRRDMDAVSRYSEKFKAPSPPPALQTSSPYKENSMLSVTVPPGSMSQDMVLCQQCRGQSSSIKRWNLSLSSSSSLEDIIISSQPAEVDHQQSPSNGRTNRPFESCPHQRLLSSQSQSSFEGLEDSNETCLSDIEPGPSARPHASSEAEAALQPGHLNGKRDTLRLSLKETVFEPGSSRRSQGEFPVILPNSKPDLPDVWIKREAQNEDSS